MGGFGQLYSANSKVRIPPLDIPLTAAVLRNKKLSFEVVDCLGLDMDATGLLFYLLEKKPLFIALRTSTPTFESDLRLSKVLKYLIDSQIILFGPHAAIYSREIVSVPFIDAVITGEPEVVLPSIVEQGGYDGCGGVTYKHNGSIISNPANQLLPMDELPFAAWDLMPYKEYDGVELMQNLKPFVTILTSKGCPHGCSYCPYPVVQGRVWRSRSSKNVADELEILEKKLGVKAVLFRDPEFSLNRSRTIEICREIVNRGITLKWRCETRIENLDEELICLMANAGCRGINIGIESADNEVLQKLNRKATPIKKAKRIIEICNKNEIETFCFFIIGLPGETKASALNTIEYALRLNPSYVQFTVATPYPGTHLHTWAEQNGYIQNKATLAMTGYEPTMRNENLTLSDMQSLLDYANSAWAMRGVKPLKRIVGQCWGATLELKRWLLFQRDKARLSHSRRNDA